jgi:tRNA dimethylallyltransferase
MTNRKYNIIVILGPTASGKTSFAATLAYKVNGEIISADSRQVYRQMTIGTGKDYADYIVNNTHIPFHLIDIVEPGYQYNVFEFQRDFFKTFNAISHKGSVPILCGGSGLYIEAVTEAYKLINVPVNQQLRNEMENKTMEELTEILKQYKTLHNTSDIENKKRAIRAIEIEEYYKLNPDVRQEFPELNPLYIGIKYDRLTERERITERLKQRLESGMIDEVKQLLDGGLTPDQLIYYGLEYKFVTQYLTGKLSYNDMFALLNTAIHQFAKRQMTWFRRMERKGAKINWIDGGWPMEEKINKILSLLSK